MALLKLLAEVADQPKQTLPIVINIDLVFRHLKLDINNFERADILKLKEQEQKLVQSEILKELEQVDINQITINQILIKNYPEDQLRSYIHQAVMQAVRQIIQPIIARSVNIAMITTRELILKDFCFESNDNKIYQAFQQMVKSLAGSLAIVTGKEPFRVELTKQLSDLLRNQTEMSTGFIKQVVDIASIENFELGSRIVAKTVVEKAEIEVLNDQDFKDKLQMMRTQGISSVITSPTKPLPERLRPEGIGNNQYSVYLSFQCDIQEQPHMLETVTFEESAEESVPEPVEIPPQETNYVMSTKQILKQHITGLEKLYAENKQLSNSEIDEGIQKMLEFCSTNRNANNNLYFCAQKLFNRMYSYENYVELYVYILYQIRNITKRIVRDITNWLLNTEDSIRFNSKVTTELLKSNLINHTDFDRILSKGLDQNSHNAVELSKSLITDICIQQNYITVTELQNTIKSLKSYSNRHSNDMELIRVLSTLDNIYPDQLSNLPQQQEQLRAVIDLKFGEWLTLISEENFVNSEKIPQYVKSIESTGVLSTDPNLEFFFKILIENSISKSKELKSNKPLDSFSKLTKVLTLLAPTQDKPRILKWALRSINKTIQTQITSADFDQRHYFRIIMGIIQECSQPTINFPEPDQASKQLILIADMLHLVNPCQVPGFAVAWLELIAHRFFLPKMLKGNYSKQIHWQKAYLLVMDLLKFVQIHFSEIPLSDHLKFYYKGILKIFVVLLQSFPEFLSNYHADFVSLLPVNCIHIKNLILSAHPREMAVVDPFTPNLKVDLIPEMGICPTILSDCTRILSNSGYQYDLDLFIQQKDITHFQNLMASLDFCSKQHKIRIFNSIIVYLTDKILENNPREANELMISIINSLNIENNQYFLDSLVNQLRYPNAHTRLLSRVLLFIFLEAKEIVQEQITRILTERIIAFRPHPWGVLITFLELIRNPRYDFFNKQFTRCTPQVEKLFNRMKEGVKQRAHYQA